MAALTTQDKGVAGGAVTLAAAAGGGDTIERSQSAGGWYMPIVLVANVGATATTITVDGTAMPAMTSAVGVFVIPPGMNGSRANITYSQVTSVTVGAASLAVRAPVIVGT